MPAASRVSFQVYCNLTEGGWTYLQHRFDGRLPFNKTMQEYIGGFGDLNAEFWLGLDKIHALTLQPRKVELEVLTKAGEWRSARYSTFSVGGPSNYTLNISGFEAGDTPRINFEYNNGRPFTRGCPGHSSYDYGWWFDYCSYIYINGIYGSLRPAYGFDIHIDHDHVFLRSSILKIQ